jgi:hypothetical protein
VTPFLSQVFFPFLELIAKVPETELAEEVFQFVGTARAVPFFFFSLCSFVSRDHARQAGGLAGCERQQRWYAINYISVQVGTHTVVNGVVVFFSEPRPLPLEADWVVDDFALFVLQILPGCISRTSVPLSAMARPHGAHCGSIHKTERLIVVCRTQSWMCGKG